MMKAHIRAVSRWQPFSPKRYGEWARTQRETGCCIVPTTYWVEQIRLAAPELRCLTFDSFIRKCQERVNDIRLVHHEWKWAMANEANATGRKNEQIINSYLQYKRFGECRLPDSLRFLKPEFAKIKALEEKRRWKTIEDDYNAFARKPASLPYDDIVVEGFHDFSVNQLEALERMVKEGVGLTIYLNREAKAAISELVKIGFTVEDVDRQPVTDGQTGCLSLYKAVTEEEEHIGLIEHILTSNTPLSNIAVLFTKSDARAAFMAKAKQEGLPIAASNRSYLADTPFYLWVKEALLTPLPSKEARLGAVDSLFAVLGITGRRCLRAKQALYAGYGTGDSEVDFFLNQIGKSPLAEGNTIAEKAALLVDMLTKMEERTDIPYAPTVKQALLALDGISYAKVETTEDGFRQWFQTFAQTLVIGEEPKPKEGISVLSWADVAAFQGSTVYVVGLALGTFPHPYSLLGYFQESDLTEINKRGVPLTSRTRSVQALQFQQLINSGMDVYASYVCGLDRDSPALPSPFLLDFQLVGFWNYQNRLNNGIGTYSRKDGTAYRGELGHFQKRLQHLQLGQEWLSDAQQAKEKAKPAVAVTAFEAYARCPFRYGLEWLLGIKPPAGQNEGLPANKIGTLIHQCIETLYRHKLNVIGKPFSTLSEAEKDEVPHWLESEWRRRFNEDIVPFVPYMNRFELEQEETWWANKLRLWWEAERARFWDRKELADAYIEGLEVPIVLEDFPLGTTKLKVTGKIDRVDVANGEKVLYDYKTGKAALKLEEASHGTKLQLPMYSYIIGKQSPVAGATYISLLDPGKRAGNGVWKPEHVGKQSIFGVSAQCRNKEDALGEEAFMEKWHIHERLQELWEGMQTNMPVAPLDCAASCPYKAICRVTEEQKREAQHAIQQRTKASN